MSVRLNSGSVVRRAVMQEEARKTAQETRGDAQGRERRLTMIKYIKCDESCMPCCDYCIHAQYERQPIVGRIVTGCAKHEDDKHKKMARNLGYCEDFYCINRMKIMLLEKQKNELHKN